MLIPIRFQYERGSSSSLASVTWLRRVSTQLLHLAASHEESGKREKDKTHKGHSQVTREESGESPIAKHRSRIRFGRLWLRAGAGGFLF